MNILITGGHGFIGSKLTTALLEREHQVVILDALSTQIHGHSPQLQRSNSDKVKFIRASVTDIKALKLALIDCNAIVHLAAETGTAQSMYQVANYNLVNSQGTALLLDQLVNQNTQIEKMVLASSRSVYGEGAYNCLTHGVVTPNPRNYTALEAGKWEPVCPLCGSTIEAIATPETARVYPASIYAATKYAQEDLTRIICNTLGIGTSILRFQNVYGAGQSLHNPYTGILSIFSTRIRQQKSVPIFEDGLESRDFVHVDDVVKAILAALESQHANTEVLNVGSGKATSILEVANLLFAALDGLPTSQPSISGQFRVGDIRHGYADISKIHKLLGWSPKISLESGILEFADWVRTQPLPEDRLDASMMELKAKRLS
jgi:dTDP-L-rhamnose 4-epimerase